MKSSQRLQCAKGGKIILGNREVIITPNIPSSVIVYSNEQLDDLKTNGIGPKGSVIGIDRTFNIGPCFLTTHTYNNRKIIKRDTLQNSIFLAQRNYIGMEKPIRVTNS